MSGTGLRVGRAVALVVTSLLAAASARAQTSALGHVPARSPYPYPVTSGAPAFRIFPGDRMFVATMKIEHAYQNAEHWSGGLRAAPHYEARRPAEPAPVEVTVAEPEAPTEMVTIRGPNGEVRKFPIAGGKAAIKTRTLIVRPGGTLRLLIRGGHVEVLNK